MRSVARGEGPAIGKILSEVWLSDEHFIEVVQL
jgi:hypothetical protein